jgi:transposase InsO family protein
MLIKPSSPVVPLSRVWPCCVKSAILHVISLAQFGLAYTRGWAANCSNARIRLKAKLDRANQEITLLREQMRITDARMASIPPQRRPHYPPPERMAILELKAARGWSLEQTAKAFLVTAATVASWMKRLDEDGPNALVRLPVPINKFPDFVHYVVQRLKTLCPSMGKVKIAQTLARAGLHLGTTTVSRMLKSKPRHKPFLSKPQADTEERIVTAKYPNHIWHVDLTVVPTGGFWTSWLPFALPQRWPFCYWLAVIIDHFSRRVMGITAFKGQPTCEAVCGFMGRTIAKAKQDSPRPLSREAGVRAICSPRLPGEGQGVRASGRKGSKAFPKYIVCDRGKQFDCDGFRKWCKRKGIKRPRYGAIGKHGSIAVVERVILTIKSLLGCLPLVPYRREAFLKELTATVEWYNQARPHTWLGGRTPNEVYFGAFPANRRPRFESRSRWPRGSPCAKPWALVRGSPGAKLTMQVSFHRGSRHLPLVALKRVA